jgi:capsular exopolysaccharide synthesis family protein
MSRQKLFLVVRHWLWLLVLAPLLAGILGFGVASRLPKVYESTGRLLIMPGQGSAPGTTSYEDVLSAERLTRTYSEVLRSRPVVEGAVTAVGLDLPYETALRQLDVRPLRDTQILQLTTRMNDPELAARFANELATQFIQQEEANRSTRFAATRDSLSKQVEQIGTDLTTRTNEAEALRAEPASPTRDSDLARVQFELTQLQQNYQAAARNYQDLQIAEARSDPLVLVLDQATPINEPVEPHVLSTVLLAALGALALAIAGAFLFEYMDDRLASPERVAQFTSLQVIGLVDFVAGAGPRLVDAKAMTTEPAGKNPYTPHSGEAYRLLRANLQFAAVEHPLRSLLVTSCDPGDGKSTTAANLAVVAAQSGARVLLVDADLRRPSLHTIFGLRNATGLTSLLVDPGLATEDALLPTHVPNLTVLLSGPLPPNPGELLASQRMADRLAELSGLADLVIIDSSPVLPVSDAAVLAGWVDASLLVVDVRRTRGHQAASAVAMLERAGARLVGAVLNRLPRSRGSYYGRYGQEYRAEPETIPAS